VIDDVKRVGINWVPMLIFSTFLFHLIEQKKALKKLRALNALSA